MTYKERLELGRAASRAFECHCTWEHELDCMFTGSMVRDEKMSQTQWDRLTEILQASEAQWNTVRQNAQKLIP